MLRSCVALLAVTVGMTVMNLGWTAIADETDVHGSPTAPNAPGVVVEGITSDLGTEGAAVPTGGSMETWEYVWLLSCFDNHPGSPMQQCSSATEFCGTIGAMRWTLWGRQVTDYSGASIETPVWVPLQWLCRVTPPPGSEPAVTDETVLQAVRRLGLPRLTVHVQPAQQTLVNLETIFHTDAPEWARTVQLLGYSVDVEATVNSYHWKFGDGTTTSSSGPGAPYPARDIVHAYADAHVTVSPRVDVEYAIRYRVDDGAWQTLDETVPAWGYPVPLQIREATALLVGD